MTDRVAKQGAYEARRRDWSLAALFRGTCRTPGVDLGAEARSIEARLWTDLVAEYDARLLQEELERRERLAAESGSRPPFSAAFHQFLDAWAKDEEKHTDALVRIYALTTGATESETYARLAKRSGDFEPMSEWLEDEFGLAVMIAYDEAMSTRAYGADIPFYLALGQRVCGDGSFGDALRELKSDEAMHYRNAVELLAHEHAGRGGDVAETLERIVAFDGEQAEYRGTFLLDHATSQFTGEEMVTVGAAVERVLRERLA